MRKNLKQAKPENLASALKYILDKFNKEYKKSLKPIVTLDSNPPDVQDYIRRHGWTPKQHNAGCAMDVSAADHETMLNYGIYVLKISNISGIFYPEERNFHIHFHSCSNYSPGWCGYRTYPPKADGYFEATVKKIKEQYKVKWYV